MQLQTSSSLKALIGFLLLWIPFNSIGQMKPQSLNVSIFNEATAIPFTRFLSTPIHPGFQIGTEFNYKKRPHYRCYQTIHTNYFYHQHLQQGIGLFTEMGYEYHHPSRVTIGALFGIGYLHTFATKKEFTFSNGNYIKKTDKGNARIYPTFSVNLGYYLKNNIQIVTVYQSWAEFPYSPGFIPVMTHINLHLGAKIPLEKKNKLT